MGAYDWLRGAYAGGGAHMLAEGRICLPKGHICLLEGRIRLAKGCIRLPEGRKRLCKGRAQLPLGRIRLQYVTLEIDPYTCLNRSERRDLTPHVLAIILPKLPESKACVEIGGLMENSSFSEKFNCHL
jgi:hypothetical protein